MPHMGRTRYSISNPGVILSGGSERTSKESHGGVIFRRFRGAEKNAHASAREAGNRWTAWSL